MHRRIPLLPLAAACSDYGFETPDHVTDDWLVQGDVDIVVFGDTSDSMGDALAILTDNFHRFVARLDDARADWHLVAVTGPDGCGQGGVITGSTPGWEEVFEAGIRTQPGRDLVDEWGLYNVAAALDQSGTGGCNEGFLRPDAALHLVFVSDEDDNSPGWDTDPRYWVPYVERYLATKQGDATRVHLTAVGGPEPTGCSAADFARGYWEAVEAVGGDFLSICDDWAFDLSALADTSVTRATFRLSEDPFPESIRVFVDDLERSGGWTFRPDARDIVFSTHLPYVGQTVAIRYDLPLGGG